MDYFKFDLQLFGAVAMTLPTVTTEVSYYIKNAKVGDAAAADQWVKASDLANTTVGGNAVTATDITAKYNPTANRLDVKIGDGDVVTVTGNATIPNTGVTVAVAKSFTDDTTGFAPAGDVTANLVTGKVIFDGVGNLTVSSVSCADTTVDAEVPASTVVLSADNKLTISNGCVAEVGGTPKNYTAAADGTVLNLTVAAAAATGVAKLAAGAVSVSASGVAVPTTAATVTNNAAVAITVDKDGKVSGLAAGTEKFTVVTTDETPVTSTYQATATGIARTTAPVAVYTATLNQVSVTAAGVVSDTAGTVLPNTLTLELTGTAVKQVTTAQPTTTVYYTVAADGTIGGGAASTAHTIGTDCIAYFKVTTDWNNGAPTVDVKLYDNNAEAATASYAGKVVVNADNVRAITDTTASATKNLTAITVTGIDSASAAADAISVTNVYHEAEVTGTSAVSYIPYATLSSANTITLPGVWTTGTPPTDVTEWCYTITPTATNTGTKGAVTYGINTTAIAGSTNVPAKTAYIMVTKTSSTANTVTFVPNSAIVGEGTEPFTVTDASWENVVLTASGVAEGVTSIVVDTKTGGLGTIAVQNVAHSVTVSSSDSTAFTTSFADGVYYKWAAGSADFVVADATGAPANDTYYYIVEFDQGTPKANANGINEIKLTKKTKAEWDADATLATNNSYFKVVATKTVEGVSVGGVEIFYNQKAGDPKLYDLTSATDPTKKLSIDVNADALTTANVSSLEFNTLMSGVVNNVVVKKEIKAGITVTDGGVAVTKATEKTAASVVAMEQPPVYGYKNNVVIDVNNLTYVENVATVYVVGEWDEEKRVITLKDSTSIGDGKSTQYPDGNRYGKYTVTRTMADGKITGVKAVYDHTDADAQDITTGTIATAIAANAKEADKRTAIDVDGNADIVKVVFPDDGSTSMVTGAVDGKTVMYESDGTTGVAAAEHTNIEYATSSQFVYGDGTAMKFTDIMTNGEVGTGTHTFYFTVEKGATTAGVTPYNISVGSNTVAAGKNYFKAVCTDSTGSITMSYHVGTGSPISAADLAEVGLVKIDGSTVATKDTTPGAEEVTTRTITLPPTVGCDVTEMPKTVNTVNVDTAGKSKYAYHATYAFTTTITLDQTEDTKTYWAVQTPNPAGSNANHGVNTCTLRKYTETQWTAVTDKTALNYFEVENGAASTTVTYHKATTGTAYVLDGSEVTLDATKGFKVAITVGSGSDDSDGLTYVAKDLVVGQSLTAAGGSNAKKDETYVTTYAINYVDDAPYTPAAGEAALSLTTGAAGHIDLTNKTDGTTYFYTITETGGDKAASGVFTYEVRQVGSAAKAKTAHDANKKIVGYITVTNGSAAGVSVSFTGFEDTTAKIGTDLSKITEKFTINAKGAASTVTAIDLSNSGTQINYALTDVAAGISVENTGTNDIYAQMATLDLTGQTLALDTTADVYWTISASGTLTRTTTKPTDGKTNYFSVNKEGSTYTVKYNQAENGTAYDLTKATLTIDASAVPNTAAPCTLTLPNGLAKAVGCKVTGAPANVVMAGNVAGDTISYSSTFSAWPTAKGTYTYLIPKTDAEGEAVEELTTSSTAVVVGPEAVAGNQKEYNKVTITVAGAGTAESPLAFSFAVASVKQSESGALGAGTTTSITTIALPAKKAGVTVPRKFDAAGGAPVDTMTFTGLENGDTVLNWQAGQTFSGKGSINVDTDGDGTVDKTFVQSGSDPIVFDGAGKAVSGTFVLSGLDSLEGSTASTLAADIKKVEITAYDETKSGDGKVYVTFENSTTAPLGGKITSITGLEDGETIQVTYGTDTTETYIYDSALGKVTRSSDGYVAGADDATANIVDLHFAADGPKLSTEVFGWTSKTYYLASGDAMTIEAGAGSAGELSAGKYIRADVNQLDGTLKLTPVTVTRAGTANKDKDFAGTITVKAANGVAIVYDKDSYAADLGAEGKFTVAFENVSKNSSFANLADDDSVDATLKNGEQVTVNGGVYTAYTEDASIAMNFVGGKIVNGTVTLKTGTTLWTSGNEKISIGTGGTTGVRVTFKNGEIASITNFSHTDLDGVITVQKYDDNDDLASTTTYTMSATVDTEVTKVVTDAVTGAVETSTITIVKDADILHPAAEALTKLKTSLDLTIVKGAVSTGYVVTDTKAGEAPAGVVKIAHNTGADHTLVAGDDGKIFIEATITAQPNTAAAAEPYTVKLTPYVYKDGKLTATGADVSQMEVTFVANGNADEATDAFKKIAYDGSKDNFKAVHFTHVAAGSELTGLGNGDTVKTGKLAADTFVTINGTKYTALAANATFNVYAENSLSTYVIDGKLVVKDTAVTSINDTVIDPGTPGDTTDDIAKYGQKYTLAYTAGKSENGTAEHKDGVTVTFANGVPTIAGIDSGEKVTVLNSVTNKTTTYEKKDTYIYKTAEDGKVYGQALADAAEIPAGGWTNLTDKAASGNTQFQWSDLKATTPKAATGYFLLEGKETQSATVADQSAKTAITYADYGKTYLVATVSTGGVLTLGTQTVQYNGDLTPASPSTTALTNTQAVTVNGIAGTKLDYTRGAEKSITLNGVGAGSAIKAGASTPAQRANDVITTTALAGATYKTDGTVDKAAETVTIYGKTYTAGDTSTTLSFQGNTATGGTFLLSGTGATATMSVTRTDSEGNVYNYVIDYTRDAALTKASEANIAVTLSNGQITGVKGLGASSTTQGEIVTITTTVTDKYGTAKTPSVTTYSAKISDEKGKTGQIVVTRDVDGTTSAHTFANDKQNIVDSSVVWTTDNYVTSLDFDWKKTGYFVARLGQVADPTLTKDAYNYNKYVATVAANNDGVTVSKADYDADNPKYYLKVETTKSGSAPAKITSMTLVKLEKDGSLVEYTSGTIGTVTIVASNLVASAGGFELPSHTNKLVITGGEAGKTYKGLNADDKISGAAGKVTLDSTEYVATTAYTMNGKGEMTFGTFTVKGTATGTAVPKHDGDLDVIVVDGTDTYSKVLKTITYTAGTDNKDGVDVTFTNGRITGVTDLEAGEKVELQQVVGAAQTKGATITISKDDDNLVTRSVVIPGVTTALTMTRTDPTGAEDILSATGYKVANKFDFGATTKEPTGQVGLFKVTGNAAAITAQEATETLAAGESYLLVAASQASSNVTINALEVFTNNAGSFEKAKGNTVLANGVTITAPTGGNLTLASGAAKLYTSYEWDDDKKAYVVDKDAADTETARKYSIAVTGAVAGKTYSGFGEKDTVKGDLVTGDTITVNGKTLTLAGDNAILIRGDGKAINGLYTLGGGIESAANVTAAEADQFTAKISGASKALVTISSGKATSITGVAAGETVKIESTNTKTGALTTTTYAAAAVADDATKLKITRTTVEDGVTSVVTGTVLATGNITVADWSAPTATLTSKFDWTSASGSGYFLTDITDTTTDLGTITVEPKTTTTEKGKYYLRVALDGDGSVSGITLHKIKDDGTPDGDVIGKVTKGTIKITAPMASPLKLNTATPAAAVFEITGATTKSEITMKAKDTLTTANLAAGDYVTVNTKKIVAGGAGVMKFADDGKLVNGVTQFTKKLNDEGTAAGIDYMTVTTSTGSFTVAAPTTKDEIPQVTVENGVVKQITGNPTKAVAVTDAGGNVVSYTNSGAAVTFTTLKAGTDITTAALAKGATFGANGGLQKFTTAEAGPLQLHVQSGAQVQVTEGTLEFTLNNPVATPTTTDLALSSGKTASYTTAVTTTAWGTTPAVTIKVEKGIVTSLTGMRAGDVFQVDGVKYTAKTSTVIEKSYEKDGKTVTDTAYLSKVDGDIINASYAVISDDDITGDESFEGQFSWTEVSGRSTGYFKINEPKKGNPNTTIVEQTVKSSPTAGKNATVKYVKANTAVDENTGNQILSIGALQVTGSADGKSVKVSETDASKILTAATKITVTAPTAAVDNVIPAISYTKTKADLYGITINKVAANSVITGLDLGDKLTTNTLAAETLNANNVPQNNAAKVTVDGIVYVAGAKGALEFVGEGDGTAETPTNKTTLVKGTILLDVRGTYDNGDYTNKTAVLAGSADGTAANITIALDDSAAVDADGNAYAAGAAPDKVLVTVDKGVVKSITGLRSKGMVLTVTPDGGSAVTYKVLNVEDDLTWKNGDDTWTKTQTVIIARTANGTTTYGSFTVNGSPDRGTYYTGAGKSIFEAYNKKGEITNYAAAVETATNTDKLWAATDPQKEKNGRVVYVEVNKVGDPYTANFAQAATDPIKGTDETNRGKKYLAMTVKNTNGVTTIQKIEVAEVDATGAMKIMKGETLKHALTNTTVVPNTVGGITIDGTNGTGVYAKINYTIPDDVPVTITNAAIGSVITGAKGYDNWATENLVSTAVTDDYTLAKGTVSMYKTVDKDEDGVNDTTVETKATYAFKAKGDSAKIAWDGTKVSKLTGFETEGESVTIVEDTEDGEKTTVYAIAKNSKTKAVEVTKTVTAVDGTKKVYSCAVPSDAATFNWVDDPADGTKYLKLANAEVVSNFDWTIAKRNTGYFEAVTKNGATSAAVKAQTKEITIKNTDAKTYIAVAVSEDYVLESVRAVKMDGTSTSETYGEMVDVTSKFTGTINVTAPTKNALTFDRSKVATEDTEDYKATIDETATVAITGALKNSRITNLALGDTVATAKLSKNVFKNNDWVGADFITVAMADDDVDAAEGLAQFKAAANGQLSFKVQNVDNAPHLTLTSGAIELRGNTARQGRGFAYVGDKRITMKGDNVNELGDITVTASTNKSGVTSYTVSDLKEGEVFTVETFGGSASTKKYWRSGNNLFCEITTGSGTTYAVYELKTATTVKSSVLEMAGEAASKSNPWVTYTEAGNATFKDDVEKGKVLTSTAKNAAVTVDLKTLASRITADDNLYKTDDNIARNFGTNSNYTFVIDKYLAKPEKFSGAASVINNRNLLNRATLAADDQADLQETIGNGGFRWYTANGVEIAQTIKATKDWNITGSDKGDTIIGSSTANRKVNGEEVATLIIGGLGNDTITAGTAKETFQFNLGADGQDTLSKFGNGKDSLTVWGFTNNWQVSLVTGGSGKSTTADVLIWSDEDGKEGYTEDDHGVTLVGMGNGKAVKIGNFDYYFGSSKATKAETFTYADDSRYYANNALNSGSKVNTLAISKTDKTKATSKTLGDTIEVDLNEIVEETGTETLRYYGIRAVDASKTGNSVKLTASNVEEAKGSILKGGTYRSTLIGGIGNDSLYGGSGADSFWFNAIEGQDTISGYAAAKDSVVLKDKTIVFSEKDTVAGSVVISASGNDVVITDADDSKNTITLQKAVGAANAINIMTDTVTKETLSYYVGATTGKKANAFTATLDKDMKFKPDEEDPKKNTQDLTMKSYYIGSDSKTDDTLKLASSAVLASGTKLDMTAASGIASHLSSIDVIDTAGLKKGSAIELIGRESGTYTLKGSNNVTEKFNLKNLAVETDDSKNNVTITNLGVGEIVELAAGMTVSMSTSGKNTICTLKQGDNSYGTITITGVASTKLSYSGGTLTRTSK